MSDFDDFSIFYPSLIDFFFHNSFIVNKQCLGTNACGHSIQPQCVNIRQKTVKLLLSYTLTIKRKRKREERILDKYVGEAM